MVLRNFGGKRKNQRKRETERQRQRKKKRRKKMDELKNFSVGVVCKFQMKHCADRRVDFGSSFPCPSSYMRFGSAAKHQFQLVNKESNPFVCHVPTLIFGLVQNGQRRNRLTGQRRMFWHKRFAMHPRIMK